MYFSANLSGTGGRPAPIWTLDGSLERGLVSCLEYVLLEFLPNVESCLCVEAGSVLCESMVTMGCMHVCSIAGFRDGIIYLYCIAIYCIASSLWCSGVRVRFIYVCSYYII